MFQPERLRDPARRRRRCTRWAPDLGVVAAYGKLIPEDLLALPRLGMINVHASLLPKYRGAAPIQRAVIDGERETGVTIMRVVKALDAGDMLANVQRRIGPDETSDARRARSRRARRHAPRDVVDRLAHGPVREEPQDERARHLRGRLTKAEGRIDWTLPATAIHNRVRGLYPWPHAYTYLDGERLIVLRTSAVEPEADGCRPGNDRRQRRPTASASPPVTAVSVIIREVQPEGRRADDRP